jgi:hypothetical protein
MEAVEGERMTVYALIPSHKRMRVSFSANEGNDVSVLYRYLPAEEASAEETTPYGGAKTMTIVLTPEEDSSKTVSVELEHGFVKVLPVPLSRGLWNALIEIGWKREAV